MGTFQGVHRLGEFAPGYCLQLAQLGDELLHPLTPQRPTAQAAAEHVDQPLQNRVEVLNHFCGITRPVKGTEPGFDVAANMTRQAVQNPPHGLAVTQHVADVFQRITEPWHQRDQRQHKIQPMFVTVRGAREVIKAAQNVVGIHRLADEGNQPQYGADHHLRQGSPLALDHLFNPVEDL